MKRLSISARIAYWGTIATAGLAGVAFVALMAAPLEPLIPWGARSTVEALVDYNADQINAQQIGRQIEIKRLQEKCNHGRCNAFERGQLQNLIAEWERTQKILDRLRSK